MSLGVGPCAAEEGVALTSWSLSAQRFSGARELGAGGTHLLLAPSDLLSPGFELIYGRPGFSIWFAFLFPGQGQ